MRLERRGAGRLPVRADAGPPRIAVALHDVEPATFARCALIRDWLGDLGIDRVTLLVIPASDLHPYGDRNPELAEWLMERVRCGDAVAQHGFQHRQTRHGSVGRQACARWRGGGAPEFLGLGDDEAKRAVDAGRRVLRLAGIQPRGFVAPAYAYTAALRRVLAASFEWWADLHGLRAEGGRRAIDSPVVALGTRSALGRPGRPVALRARALAAGELLRLDLHPADLEHRAKVGAVEAVLRRTQHRRAVTYDELARS